MDKCFSIKFCRPEIVCQLKVIHYGSKSFDTAMFNPVSSIPFESLSLKPDGALWTSPDIEINPWKKFCIEGIEMTEDDFKDFFRLAFSPGSRIAIIDSSEDLENLPKISNKANRVIDWKMISMYADAVWLTAKGEKSCRWGVPTNLYTWDCETILIFNPDCCKQV